MNDKKIKYLTITVFALIAVNLALIIFLMMPKPPRESRHQNRMKNRGAQFLVKRLNLTSEQESEFKIAFEKHRAEKDQIEKEIRKQKKALFRSAIAGDSIAAKRIIQET